MWVRVGWVAVNRSRKVTLAPDKTKKEVEAVTIQARGEPGRGSRVSSKSNKIFHSVGAEGGFGRVGPATNNGRVEPTDGYFAVSRYFFFYLRILRRRTPRTTPSRAVPTPWSMARTWSPIWT